MCAAVLMMLRRSLLRMSLCSILPVNTGRYLYVDSMSFERYGRQIDVKTTSCAYWDSYPLRYSK